MTYSSASKTTRQMCYLRTSALRDMNVCSTCFACEILSSIAFSRLLISFTVSWTRVLFNCAPRSRKSQGSNSTSFLTSTVLALPGRSFARFAERFTALGPRAFLRPLDSEAEVVSENCGEGGEQSDSRTGSKASNSLRTASSKLSAGSRELFAIMSMHKQSCCLHATGYMAVTGIRCVLG